MAERYEIVSKGGRWRGFLPVYSADQALGTLAIVGGIFVLIWLLDPKAAFVVTAGAALGGSVVNYQARPAYFVIGKERAPLVIEALESIAYIYIAERDHWVPPIPRWMRWTYNFVEMNHAASEVRVEGPANLLHFLAAKV